jgi:ABC-type Fe3+-hydroxamate transport system substrate-binding protein
MIPVSPLIKPKLSNRVCCGMIYAAAVKHCRLMLLLPLSLVLALASTGCSFSKSGAPPTTKTTASSVSTTKAPTVITTTTKTTPTTTPALAQTSFSLALVSPQTSAGYTLPIYLSQNSTLHLVWTVSGVGENMRMKINTPDGKIVEVEPDGSFVTISPDDPCDQLNSSGSIILKPATQKLSGGYYVFYPYICNGDQTVNVKIMYWIEQ